MEPSLKRHKDAFGSAPELYGSDRGFFSESNVTSCERGGVKVVCIPQRGGKKTPEREAYEKSPAFKKGQRFRAGIEGRISVLFRGRGMKRCLAQRATSVSTIGWRCRARQQLDDDCVLADETIVSQTKSCLTDSQPLAHSDGWLLHHVAGSPQSRASQNMAAKYMPNNNCRCRSRPRFY